MSCETHSTQVGAACAKLGVPIRQVAASAANGRHGPQTLVGVLEKLRGGTLEERLAYARQLLRGPALTQPQRQAILAAFASPEQVPEPWAVDRRVQTYLAAALVPQTGAEVSALSALAQDAGSGRGRAALGSLAEASARGYARATAALKDLSATRPFLSATVLARRIACRLRGEAPAETVFDGRPSVARLKPWRGGSGYGDIICCPRCDGEDVRIMGFVLEFDGRWHDSDVSSAAFGPDGFAVVPLDMDEMDWWNVDDHSTTQELAACRDCGYPGELGDFGFADPDRRHPRW